MPLKFSKESTNNSALNFQYPSSIEDLCIHKKKISQICDFFTFHCKQTPILLVTGPTGCGKSTAIRIIGKQLGWSFIEWDNSIIANDDYEQKRESVFQQFESFLLNGFRISYRSNHFLLVEEYPITLDNIGMRTKFTNLQSQLLDLMAGGRIKPIPIVFLWSDTNDHSKEGGDIFCKKFRNSPNVLHISLNEVAVTFMKRALKCHISAKYSNANGQVKRLAKCIDKVAEVSSGDVRYGINLISLLASFPPHMAHDACKLEMFSRDNRIETFHALGKIILRRKDFQLFDYAVDLHSISMLNLYLEQNVYDFYSEIEPLSEYLELLSIGEAKSEWSDSHLSSVKYLSALYLQKCCNYPIKFSQHMFKKPDFYSARIPQKRMNDSQNLRIAPPEELMNNIHNIV